MNNKNISKIAIHRTADEQIDLALTKVSAGFDYGKITKTDFVSWLISTGIERLTPSDIQKIQHANFNQALYLQKLAQQLKFSGRNELSSEEKLLLQNILGTPVKNVGRPRKVKSASQPTSDKSAL